MKLKVVLIIVAIAILVIAALFILSGGPRAVSGGSVYQPSTAIGGMISETGNNVLENIKLNPFRENV